MTTETKRMKNIWDEHYLWGLYKEKYFTTEPKFTFPPDHCGADTIEFTELLGGEDYQHVMINTCQDCIEITYWKNKAGKNGRNRRTYHSVHIPLHVLKALREDIEETYFLEDYKGWQKEMKSGN